jgi:hypothetical protein
MNLSLSNGDKVAIWDTIGADTENSWANVTGWNFVEMVGSWAK